MQVASTSVNFVKVLDQKFDCVKTHVREEGRLFRHDDSQKPPGKIQNNVFRQQRHLYSLASDPTQSSLPSGGVAESSSSILNAAGKWRIPLLQKIFAEYSTLPQLYLVQLLGGFSPMYVL